MILLDKHVEVRYLSIIGIHNRHSDIKIDRDSGGKNNVIPGRNAVYGIFQFLPKMTFFAVSDLDIRKERKNKARKKISKKNF